MASLLISLVRGGIACCVSRSLRRSPKTGRVCHRHRASHRIEPLWFRVRALPIAEKLRALQVPILVFRRERIVGANLPLTHSRLRHDVFGASTPCPHGASKACPEITKSRGPARGFEPQSAAGLYEATDYFRLRRLWRLFT